ncbi:MAG TPA: hypothetical protein VK524_34510 [Polyangiaceae bacterium]|nr:hypothetical protein [Polyangiaceae bacterium]
MEIPDGYTKCLDAMAEAAQRWVREHPFAGPLQFTDLEQEMARRAGRPGDRVAVIAALADVLDRWAANADTRSFLQALVTASDGQATFLQARALVAQATQAMLERGSGELPEGQWSCTGCAKVLNGFTNTSGDGAAPGAGDITVCADCGVFQRVNAECSGYEALETRDFNALPKSARKHLLAIRAAVTERIAREKRSD